MCMSASLLLLSYIKHNPPSLYCLSDMDENMPQPFQRELPQKFYQLHVQIIVLAVGGLIKDDENDRE